MPKEGRIATRPRPTVNQVTGPDALRYPELHDFSDLPAIGGYRPLLIVLVLAALLTIGHFVWQGHAGTAEADLVQQKIGAHV